MGGVNYAGFPRDTGDHRERVVYPPKDESWRSEANCLGANPDLFFPERGEDTAAAKAVCRGCVVRAACLEYALTPPFEMWGVWGAASEVQRRRMRQELPVEVRRRRRVPHPHGTRNRYGAGCHCDACREANADYMRRTRGA